MSQTNVREGYRITTLEVVELVEDLISYLAVAKCTQLRNAQIPKVFHKAAVRQYGAKVKTEDLSNTPTLTLSKTAQRQSSSVVSNRSTASITNKFSVASLTKPAILNDANVALVDAVHHSVIDALTITLIKDDDDLLGTVNSHIKSRRLRAVMLLLTFQPNEPPEQLLPPEQPLPPKKRADSRHAKASRGRTKKDKDSEDSNTSSDVPRSRRRDRAAACARSAERKQLGKEAQLKKTRDKEELAKAKKEKEEKEAQKRETQLDSLLDSDDYRSDSSSDINPKDDSEDEEATTAKDLAREQKERLKALLNAKTRDSLSARVGTAIKHLFFSVSIDNLQNKRTIKLPASESDATEYNAVNNDDKLYPTKGERTFHCACERSSSFNAEPQQARSLPLIKANTPAVHPEATKHRPAPSAAQFVIVCGFRKVDKHVFRAYNTISVTAQRTIIRKGGPHMKKRAILLPSHVTFNATNKRDSVTSNRIYKIEDAVYWSIAEIPSYRTRQNTALNGLAMAKQYRRVIFNRFKMQAIASYSALATLKAAQFKTYSSCKVKRFTSNSVKDLFTNLSKDHFLVREARAITKSSLKFQNLSNLYSELAEMCVSIVYFNLDSELELKVLGKQDVKTTSRDKLQSRGSTVTDQRID
ncbi:hypothetical protein HBH48_217840 [Parastagonospora nodorum]|nr:hypothetical protein HBH48_217840 [Parastagonospora nodorum]